MMSPADRRYGYKFGVDGFLSRKDAADFLGLSVRQIDRLIADGKIRRAKTGESRRATVRICTRSLTEYVSSAEC